MLENTLSTSTRYDVNTFVFDMDGTLLNEAHALAPLTLRALGELRERGANLVIATGRHFNDIRSYLKQLGGGIATITCNGANIHNGDGELIYRDGLPQDVNQALIPLAAQFDVHTNMYTDTEWLVTAPCEELLEAHELDHFAYRQIDMQAMINARALKILFYGKNAELQSLKAQIERDYSLAINLTFSDQYYLEVMNNNISKGYSLKVLLEKLSLPVERTMAFGDGFNDVELFRSVAHPVLMENSSSSLKQLFPHAARAQPNYNDGVAQFLLDNVL
ncbi:MAG: Cof-type HAD-IIB family hydrolase [Cellvibrio sp.]|uniref:Cof-type HAD-IIB family hydrolase n=1 Tax=Cellvibrio sp. TaxID=1965322 RepID=UPI0031A13110